jgi:hypothetical protein
MRWVLGVALVIAVTGCGGAPKLAGQAATKEPIVKPLRRCTHTSSGFRACTAFGFPVGGERSSIQRRDGTEWKILVGPPKARHGWWRRIVASADGRSLLAQWSGECEIQSTYLVATASGKERPIFRGNSSTAIGWSEPGRARVRLPAPLYGTDKSILFQSGIYLVDSETMAVSLERPSAKRPGC